MVEVFGVCCGGAGQLQSEERVGEVGEVNYSQRNALGRLGRSVGGSVPSANDGGKEQRLARRGNDVGTTWASGCKV